MHNLKDIKIQFLGAAGTVTGSKYLIQTPEKTILLDCGMFQGLKSLRLLNWKEFPINSSKIDCVLLTHGHLDHVGYLPKLVAQGFTGNIYGTEPTLEVAKLILEDSAKIQEEDAARANAKGYSKHHPAKPLYDLKDVEKTVPHFRPQPLDELIKLSEGISFRFKYNSHILGATFIELKIADTVLVFSGDIGRSNDLLMYPPKKPKHADVLFIESTYGDRLHPELPVEQLKEVIKAAATRKGTIIVPGFAVERIQMLMYLLWKLRKAHEIPNLPLYMDSPMGKNVLDIFHHNQSWHKLPTDDCNEMCKDIRLIKSIDETLNLARDKKAKIIIAGSGMGSGGRVLTYFQNLLGDAASTVLLVGYQAEGTRGRQLLEGAKEIKLYGKYYEVKAKIENIEGLSAHADQKGLIDWLSEIENKPAKVYVVHGEAGAAQAFSQKIENIYGWKTEIPKLNDIITVELKSKSTTWK